MGAFTHVVRNAASLQKAVSIARPVSGVEFSKVWERLWPKSGETRLGARTESTIGLAISGGVDSMALAFLCSSMKAQLSQSKVSVNFRAFVVDHGVRKGSDIEAQAVSQSLEKRGIPTQVLKMQWPETLQTPGLPNFESSARKYRFRTLGKACSAWGIDSLLLAHHEDDQVETIMMRLMDGHRIGLTGIKDHAQIPECYGVHGVYQSGGLSTQLQEYESNSPETGKQIRLNDQGVAEWKSQLPIETGGVRVYRPLLGFSKERLIATCQENKVEWFEDHTNKDQTLTKRNAIRYMRASYSLPKALSGPALLSLSQKMKEQEQRRKEVVEEWLLHCNITSLDLQTGTMEVRFADLMRFKELSSWPGRRAGQIAADLLKRIVMLISAHEHIRTSSLHGGVARLFPELSLSNSSDELQKGGFTVCGLYFQAIPSPPSFDVFGKDKGPPLSRLEHEKSKPTWHISRQPFRDHEAGKSTLVFPPAPTSGPSWSPFQLFDGRHWIRVKTTSSFPVSHQIQPLTPTQWQRFKEDLGKKRFRAVEIMKEKAVGGIRFTLPALVLRNEHVDGEARAEGRVVALPTMGIYLPETVGRGKGVEVEVRYKKIRTEGLAILGEGVH